jgi:hypothetical protein
MRFPPTLAIGCDMGKDDEALVHLVIIIPHSESNSKVWFGTTAS